MSRRVAWIAAGIAGLLAAGGVTAASASATAAAPPVAAPHWHIVKSVKTDDTGDFTAVVATGKTTGWAFDGNGFSSPPTAWERTGSAWTKVAFPSKAGEQVVAADGTSPANVWAFTDIAPSQSRVLKWDGHKWSVVKTFPELIGGASVLGGNDVWVFGNAPAPFTPALGAWRYNGHTWSQTGKNIEGGSALAANSVWAFSGTSVDHWIGAKWTSTPVRSLLPPKQNSGLNDPAVTGILALSASNVYAIGNGNAQDEGGPTVVLHYNGHKWTKVASGQFGYGAGQRLSTDGSGGLWLPMPSVLGAPSYMVHYAAGKLIKVKLPLAAQNINIVSVTRIPGTTQQLAGGFTHASGNYGTNVVAVLLQYS